MATAATPVKAPVTAPLAVVNQPGLFYTSVKDRAGSPHSPPMICNGDNPLACFVVGVENERAPNLVIYDTEGSLFFRSEVPAILPGMETPGESYVTL